MMKLIITPTILIILVIGTMTMTGCEKQVVREEYSPLTGLHRGEYQPMTGMDNQSYDSRNKPPAKRKKKGILESTGDFLFGWMEPKPKPKPESDTTAVRPPMWQNYDQYRVQTSPPAGTPPP